MKSFKLINLTAVLALACAPMVNAKMNGFGEETTCIQGKGGHEVDCTTTNNNGTTETTTTGPKGQLQNDKDHNTTPGPTCGPGNSTGC
jgi:hypothetical protein